MHILNTRLFWLKFLYHVNFRVDKVTIPSKLGKGVLRRVPEVFDCWFESGSMPYAQVHYPFEHKKDFDDNFPADFIAEGIDQTRGWWVMIFSQYLHCVHFHSRLSKNDKNHWLQSLEPSAFVKFCTHSEFPVTVNPSAVFMHGCLCMTFRLCLSVIIDLCKIINVISKQMWTDKERIWLLFKIQTFSVQ